MGVVFMLRPSSTIVKNFYLFKRNKKFIESRLHQLRLSSEFVLSYLKNSPGVLYVEQQEHINRVLRTTDTEWNVMWYMNGMVTPSMKITEAWDLGMTGNGVDICILDDGIEVDHPDLVNNLKTDEDYDFIDGDEDASPGSKANSHGTEVAGLIGAKKDNANCVVGVAYESNMIGVRLVGASRTDDMEASALVHKLAIADIYSNSWGPSDSRGPIDGFGYFGPKAETQGALEDGIDNGRDGRGAIYVWSSGSGTKTDNCNGNGYVNSIFTVAIASIGHNQEPAPYAEICAPALAAAYGGGGGDYLVSTSTNGSCSRNLEGTSYATAIATGIIALALEANPLLTWRDVQHLIVLTSKKHNIVETEYGGWQLNGARKPFSQRVGFGLMDAEAMVTMATTWQTVPVWEWCDISQNVNMDVTYDSPLSSTKAVSHCAIHYVEHVRVNIVFVATKRGRVELKFTSPLEQ
ncbi:hypothetical protein ScPMuIL_014371 [Solemya velum]